MLSHIFRWSALSALVLLGAMVFPPSLQGQEAAAASGGNTAVQAVTLVASPFLVTNPAQATTAEPSSLAERAGQAPVVNPSLALSDPLRVPFGVNMPVPASPLPLSMAPKQDDDVHVGANLALMAVGGAALVTGLVIDNDAGTILAVGGGVVFLVGFYRWLR